MVSDSELGHWREKLENAEEDREVATAKLASAKSGLTRANVEVELAKASQQSAAARGGRRSTAQSHSFDDRGRSLDDPFVDRRLRAGKQHRARLVDSAWREQTAVPLGGRTRSWPRSRFRRI